MTDLIKQFAGREDLPERDADEHYETKYNDASLMSEILYRYWYSTRPDERPRLVDIGADNGIWGTAFAEVVEDLDFRKIRSRMTYALAGIEKRITERYTNPDKHDVLYHEWVVGDATDMEMHPDGDEYQIAFGNPPFLKSKKPGELMSQFLFDLKTKYEVCGFLLQTNYLASDQRYQLLFQSGLAVVAQSISRIHFAGRGNQQYREYAFYIWDQKYPVDQMPQLTWFDSNKQFIDPRFLARYGGQDGQ